jgi:hypothetical protein
MKRYLTGIIAVVIAIGMAAFTAPAKKPLSTSTFRYTLGTYTQPQVQDNNNWVSGASLCGGTANKACQMEVDDTYTHLDANNKRELNTTGSVIVIKAKFGVAGTDYVPNPSTSTGISSPVDKP